MTSTVTHAGVTFRPGQLLRMIQNPYPLKGHPDAFCPWEVGALYTVTDVTDMGGKYAGLVAFKAVPGGGDTETDAHWEVGADTVALGFEVLTAAPSGRA